MLTLIKTIERIGKGGKRQNEQQSKFYPLCMHCYRVYNSHSVCYQRIYCIKCVIMGMIVCACKFNHNSDYRMADNFRGVLIFVIFIVDLAVAKIFHPRKLISMVLWLCKSVMMGVATNIVAVWPTLTSVSKQQ